jgi:hypothetical protein
MRFNKEGAAIIEIGQTMKEEEHKRWRACEREVASAVSADRMVKKGRKSHS